MLFLLDRSLTPLLWMSVYTKTWASHKSARCKMYEGLEMGSDREQKDSRRWLTKIKVVREKGNINMTADLERTSVISHWDVGRKFLQIITPSLLSNKSDLADLVFISNIMSYKFDWYEYKGENVLLVSKLLLQCCLEGSVLAWMKMFECREGESEH